MNQRALRSDLQRALTNSDAWPTHAALTTWIRDGSGDLPDDERSMRNATYGEIRRGHPVTPRHLKAFVAYYLDCLAGGRQRSFVATVTKYLATQGVHDPFSQTPSQLFDVMVTDEDPDALMGEFGTYVHQLGKRGIPLDPRLVAPAEIDEVARWVFIEAGRNERITGHRLSEEEAIAIGAEKFRYRLQDYADHLRAMHRVDPWTLVYAMGKKGRTGFTSMHPVTPAAYERVRRGEIATYEIEAEDMISPSRHLVFEGLASCPMAIEMCPFVTSWYMLHAVLCQVAGLTFGDPDLYRKPIQVLAPAGTPLNEQRLIRARYKKVADAMGGRKIKVFERVLRLSPKRPSDWMFYLHLVASGHRLRTSPDSRPSRERVNAEKPEELTSW